MAEFRIWNSHAPFSTLFSRAFLCLDYHHAKSSSRIVYEFFKDSSRCSFIMLAKVFKNPCLTILKPLVMPDEVLRHARRRIVSVTVQHYGASISRHVVKLCERPSMQA